MIVLISSLMWLSQNDTNHKGPVIQENASNTLLLNHGQEHIQTLIDPIVAHDGNYIIGGNLGDDAFIFKFTSNHEVAWHVKFSGDDETVLSNI